MYYLDVDYSKITNIFSKQNRLIHKNFEFPLYSITVMFLISLWWYYCYSQLFTKSDNTTLLKEGDLLKRPELARTLKEIAKRTPDEAVEYFYNSNFTDALVADINNYGGNITKEDFINYNALEYDALVSEFGQLKVLGTPAPSSGSIFIFILNILKGLCLLNTLTIISIASFILLQS